MDAVKLRRGIAALGLLGLTVAGLSACQSHVGAAAVVDGHRIAESDVSQYVSASGISASVRQQARGPLVAPRVQALNELIKTQVFETALTHMGGVPGKNQLAKLHDKAAQLLLGGSGPGLDRQLHSQAAGYGLTGSFVDVLLRDLELEYLVVQRSKAGQFSDLARAVAPYAKDVHVSPRYGSWRPSSLSLSPKPKAGVPSFIRYGSALSATS